MVSIGGVLTVRKCKVIGDAINTLYLDPGSSYMSAYIYKN